MIKDFVQELEWRGMIHTIMPGAKEQLQKEMTTIMHQLTKNLKQRMIQIKNKTIK